jgi:selenide,water dikinase
MGGRPITAMNIVCFPIDDMPTTVLQEILEGGLEKINESGAVLAGGHSVDDRELKYGLSVTGLIHPDKILTNCKARVGDHLILTKPIGIGVLATAIKGKVADRQTIQTLIDVAATLNKKAAEIMLPFAPSACTDITGFGLAGHLLEMAKGSRKQIRIDTGNIPFIPQAVEYANMGLIPAGTYNNRKFCEQHILIDSSVKQVFSDLLFDPQTSGGLLISLPEKQSGECLNMMRDEGISAAVIGEITGDHPDGLITIT